MNNEKTVLGQLVDVGNRAIYPAKITFQNGIIANIEPLPEAPLRYIIPGFVDAHIHIESSMLAPSEFAKIAIKHGTVATVSDPHEIANVCGIAGIEYMLNNAKTVPLKFNFGAPSCVPATNFETAGAIVSSADIASLLQRTDIKYLAEMMNFPGVLFEDKEVMAKIEAAKSEGKPVDGHAPGLRGEQARKYINSGITTDHECTTLDEALDKIQHGMKILIREGSAAKNYEALAPLLQLHPAKTMFCSDDKHPDELVKGHINLLVKRAIAEGYNLFDVLYAACIAPVQHYNLDVGTLLKDQPADFLIVNNLTDFSILETYIDGQLCWNGEDVLFDAPQPEIINNFETTFLRPENIVIKSDSDFQDCNIINAIDGQLITTSSTECFRVINGSVQTDVEKDILKIGVLNRYCQAPPALGFIKNFGLKKGALASSVAHDSHNIVFVGVDDESICTAVNQIIEQRGGISTALKNESDIFPLPIAGLMTNQDASTAAMEYERLDKKAKMFGCKLKAPFMTLSFMALPVIPSLKITDKGLFDVDKFRYENLFFEENK